MQKRRKHPPAVPTAQSLHNVALFYLSRYAASEGGLRRVLQNRLRKAALLHPDFSRDAAKQAELRNAIETIVEKNRKSGILNDAAYASMKAESLRRGGRSRRYILQKLQQKGLAVETIGKALRDADGPEKDGSEAEMKAAYAFAKKRKFGIFRKVKADEARLHKELGSFARAGFSLDVARRVLGKKASEDFDLDSGLD